jgi:RimJ/RimL family protein N-acetyltransferase
MRSVVEWQRPDGVYRALEPGLAELEARALQIAVAYNDPYNKAMMDNREEFSARGVLDLWKEMRKAGGRPFLLYRDGLWMGDADFRGIEDGRAEFAIMIGPRAGQGKGVGTAFGVMLHALAFQVWRLERVYVTILPANIPSQRLFARLGYRIDESATARSYADNDGDVSMSCDEAAFLAAHQAAVSELRFGEEA